MVREFNDIILFRAFIFFSLMAIIGTILDLVWFRYIYKIFSKFMIPLAVIANAVSWGLMIAVFVGMIKSGSSYGLMWLVLLAKFVLYLWPLSLIKDPTLYTYNTIFLPILYPLMAAFIIAYFLQLLPYFQILNLF